MKFVHHNTGEWTRSNDWSSAVRTEGSVTEYDSLDAIPNQWLRGTFKWMVDQGEVCLTFGSDVFQIRL